ncbi:hypothetical protein [Sphingobium cloacae]|uniref:Integron n=1 Tax=Sphingobium cloacae TaxID=120107 RepID=A0A1E1F452_9SPHN|nr:hypothetical protein [Sphingobium cloacae]BAV65277.1 hypothetical protein SCLO_1022370 [Sphingobium cloacae]
MRSLISLFLLLSACSDRSSVLEELPNSSVAGAPRETAPETKLESRLTRPVIIGEDGPRLDACGGLGQVIRAGAKGLAVRAAPFDEAQEIGRMAEGGRAFLCTRSIDQKWLGVVIPPEASGTTGDASEAVDCGVSSPVDRKQPYDGPCQSGWVSSAFIRLIGG